VHATQHSLTETVRRAARTAGFDACGIARVDQLGAEPGRRLDDFLSQGRHGDMDWLEAHAERRRHPQRLWPEARSIVALGLSYAPPSDPLAILDQPERGAISCYAKGKDYHDILKGRLKQVAGMLHRASGQDVKVFVDTAPLMEKPLAQLAGLGWQGKHTNLVSRQHGSWLFLGAILSAAELEPDAPESPHCGRCQRCIDACPTRAIPAPYQLDARRCIAYLTIEYRGHIAPEFRPLIGNRVFGCDDCLAVCPWNKFAATSREQRFASRESTDNPALATLLTLDDATFRLQYAGTPIKRTGRDRFIRNVLIAAGNSGNRTLVPLIIPLLADPAAIVRAMAVWALARLAPNELEQRRAAALTEDDADVRAEWARARGEETPLAT
jgi:epoxyqueuosine reductase